MLLEYMTDMSFVLAALIGELSLFHTCICGGGAFDSAPADVAAVKQPVAFDSRQLFIHFFLRLNECTPFRCCQKNAAAVRVQCTVFLLRPGMQ